MICSTLLLALSLTPQPPENANTPVLFEAFITLAVDQPTALANPPLATNRVWYRKPFVEPGATPGAHPETDGGLPYFSAITPQVQPPWVHPGVEIDAFSTNVNYLAVTPAGVIDKGLILYTWAGLAVSVEDGAEGEGSESVFQQNLNQPNGADVYEYMFPQSSEGEENELVLALNENQITLSAGTDEPEITALELYAAALSNPKNLLGNLHGAFESVVFSVTQASVDSGSVPSTWFQPEGGGQQYPMDGASLIRVDWEEEVPGSGAYDWSAPYLFRTAAEMGLTAEVEGQTVIYDLTAVAWHSYVAPVEERYLLFSSKKPEWAPEGTPVLDPLLFLDLTAVPPVGGEWTPTPLKAVVEVAAGSSETRLVSSEMKLKLGVDKIDALSAFDPRYDLTKIISVGDGTQPVLQSRVYRDISYPQGNPDCDLVTGMRDPTGTVLADTAVLLGRFPDAVPTVHAVLPWSAGTARYTIGDVPAILFGVPYQTQWVALLGSATVATSNWQSIDI